MTIDAGAAKAPAGPGRDGGIFRVRKDRLNAYAEGRIPFLNVITYGRENGLPGLPCYPGAQSLVGVDIHRSDDAP
jgi:hypothetical protein